MGTRVVVAGASMAGLRVAEQLVRLGHEGPVTVIGEESHLPYNRPPLSKAAMADPHPGTAEAVLAKLSLRRTDMPNTEFRLGDPIVGVDLSQRVIRTGDGHAESFDGLVVATGLRPRRLQVAGPAAGRFALRTVDDCLAIRSAVHGARRAVIVGAGFIGCEIAATLNGLGLSVVVVEPGPCAMARALGLDLGLAVQRHHEATGITFRTETSVVEVLGDDRVTGVILSSGEQIPADLVVEAIGSLPNTEWLQGNPGIDLSDGVLCTEDLRVEGADSVVAAGDVARYPHPLFGPEARRFEHWALVTETARRAGTALHADLSATPVGLGPIVAPPSFWTDQGLIRLQAVGAVVRADEWSVTEGRLDRLTDGVLLVGSAGGRLCCAIVVNLPVNRLAPWRTQIVDQTKQMDIRRSAAGNS